MGLPLHHPLNLPESMAATQHEKQRCQPSRPACKRLIRGVQDNPHPRKCHCGQSTVFEGNDFAWSVVFSLVELLPTCLG